MVPTVSRAVRGEMPILRVLTPTENMINRPLRGGYVLSEIIVVIFIIGLMVAMATMNAVSMLGRNTFNSQAGELVNAFDKAWMGARTSSRRYEIVIDITNQFYMLREITENNLSDVLEEEVIAQKKFGDEMKVKYVIFDDAMNTSTTQDWARFRAGHAGWQAGGKIVLVDRSGNEYSIIVTRLSPQVQLKKGDVEFVQPQDDVPF
jgi:Tfp pilus assembly protein FimT